jgi:hypothetical protein
MSRPVASRRAFLGTMGAAGMGALIPSLEAEAQTAGAKKRLIMLTSGNGTVPSQWKPSGSNTSLTLSTALAPLEMYKQDLIAINGLGWQYGDGPGVDHMRIAMMWNGTPMLTGTDFSNSTNDRPCGWGGGISVDQTIANKLAETVKTPFKSLEFGVYLPRHHIYTRVNYAAANQPIPPVDDPYAMFDRVFKNLAPMAGPGGIDKLRASRKSVMDAVKGNLAAVQARVSAGDRQKIEAHLESVRSIEKRLDNTTPVSCAAPMLPTTKLDARANANFPVISRLQIDLLVAALLCDVTRVTSLLWAGAANEVRFTWLNQTSGAHTISHDNSANGQSQRVAAHVWFSGEVAYLLGKLKAIPDGTGTLLDNSLVVWGNELADGAAHSQQPIPVLIAGKAGGVLKTGRFIDYGKKKHNGLLVSMAQLMGLPEITKFGSLDDGSGPLSGLV